MLSNIGPGAFILLIILILILFGPNKLPELGRSAGKTLREFKTGASNLIDADVDDDIEPSKNKTEKGENTKNHER